MSNFQPYHLPSRTQELVERPHVFYRRQCTVGGHDLYSNAMLQSCITPQCPHTVCYTHWKQTLRFSKSAFHSPWLCGFCSGQQERDQTEKADCEDAREDDPQDDEQAGLPTALSAPTRRDLSCNEFPNLPSFFEGIETSQREIEAAVRSRLNLAHDESAENRFLF